MPRLKGSKNKPKKGDLRELVERPRPLKPEVVSPKNNKPQGHPLAEVKKWNPSPGSTKVGGPCSVCKHERKLHYDGGSDWCNSPGCNCQAWNA